MVMILQNNTQHNIKKHVASNKQTNLKTNNSTQNLVNPKLMSQKQSNVSFQGLLDAKNLTSPRLHKVLKFANEYQLQFGAAYALLLTCVLRPGSIMLFPSKKNKEDQRYASAHSIASGIIGFVISTILFRPLEKGIKNLTDNIGKGYSNDPKKAEVLKGSYLKDSNYLDAAKTYVGRFGDLVGSIPKGILTIALIPIILKNVFGMEKKKHVDNEVSAPAITNHSSFNFKSKEAPAKNVFQNFNGGVR